MMTAGTTNPLDGVASPTPTDGFAAFHTAMARLAGKRSSWGFIIVRTAFHDDDDDDDQDASQWARAYAVLNRTKRDSIAGTWGCGRADAGRAEFAPDPDVKTADGFELPVIANRSLLGQDLDAVRAAVNKQVQRYRDGRQRWIEIMEDSDEDDDPIHSGEGEGGVTPAPWCSQLQLDVFLIIDCKALAALLAVANKDNNDDATSIPNRQEHAAEAQLLLLDSADPVDVPYEGGSPFLGWMRVHMQALGELDSELSGPRGSDASRRAMRIYPQRAHAGQVPVYHGGSGMVRDTGHMSLPKGDGAVAHATFPRGTPRGWQGLVAMWESIPEELRGRQRLGQPPAWFIKQQQQQ
ncbi:hypothetical protein MN608_09244 [Microdochium nivale]|nr:hypothetical protein MN608_09244 [Microdochium nivale]